MKILFPENIFTSMIALFLPEELRNNLSFQPASSISAALDMERNSIGLIPALDILNHRKLVVSSKYGISFEGSLCNTYIYFSENRSVKSLNITGDVSSSEVILSRILFKEVYNLEVEAALSASLKKENNNLIIAGNKNFYDDKLFDGISFSEEIIELLSLPYINYVLASQDNELIKQIEPALLEKIPDVYDTSNNLGQYFSFSEKILNYIQQNVSSLVLEFDDHDMEALKQLLLLPYFHGLIKEIIEPKIA